MHKMRVEEQTKMKYKRLEGDMSVEIPDGAAVSRRERV